MKEKKGFMQEFKEFISRGNVIDMAVGIIIGSAFTAIVTSLVQDLIMPIIGIALGKVNFNELKVVLTPASGDIAESAIYYGAFIQKLVDFILVALVVFILVKQINKIKAKKEKEEAEKAEEAPAVAPDIELLTEIRDLLKKE